LAHFLSFFNFSGTSKKKAIAFYKGILHKREERGVKSIKPTMGTDHPCFVKFTFTPGTSGKK